MNGEPLRPQQGFPVRLIVPGFEGIFNTKWLRHIKAVDQYQLNMNDFGHLRRDATDAALGYHDGDPSRSSRSPPAHRNCPNADGTRSQGWPGPARAPFVRWRYPPTAGRRGTTPSSRGLRIRMAHTRFGYMWNWDGDEHVIMSRTTDEIGSGPTDSRASRQGFGRGLYPKVQAAWEQQHHYAVEDRQRRERD